MYVSYIIFTFENLYFLYTFCENYFSEACLSEKFYIKFN